jgi:putative methionine-R-sulfoxide reductase with GAF domain
MPRPVVADPVSVRPVHPEQVEHLLKLQKWSRKITSILDLDELIDHVVNDVSCAFGCVETNLYLHDEDHGELEAAGIHGCKVHEKGSRLKVGKEGMVGYVASTLQMRYAPDVRKDPYYIACQESTRSEVAIPLLVDGKLVGVFSASHHDLDAFPREQLRMLQGLCDHLAVAVRSPRDSAGSVAQEFALHSRLRYFRIVHSGWRRGRRLVRLHFLRRWLLGIGPGGRFGKRHGGRSADVRNPRHAALSGADLQRPGRSADSTKSLAGRRFSVRQVRHYVVCGAESVHPDVDIFQRRPPAAAAGG